MTRLLLSALFVLSGTLAGCQSQETTTAQQAMTLTPAQKEIQELKVAFETLRTDYKTFNDAHDGIAVKLWKVYRDIFHLEMSSPEFAERSDQLKARFDRLTATARQLEEERLGLREKFKINERWSALQQKVQDWHSKRQSPTPQ